MKSQSFKEKLKITRSRPARGAWVEIQHERNCEEQQQSRPARGAWVEIKKWEADAPHYKSRPARGAWVEIDWISATIFDIAVAPRKGRVG